MRKSSRSSARAALLALGVALPASSRAVEPRAVSCAVDQAGVPLDREIELSCTLTGPSSIWREPDLRSFRVLARWRVMTESPGPGPNEPRQILRFLLAPTRVGPARIGPFQLLAGDQVISQSEPILVRVVDAEPVEPIDPAAARDLSGFVTEAWFIRVAPPQDAYYAGEPIELVWELWHLEPADPPIEIVREPLFDGVGSYQLEPPPVVAERELAGRRYRVVAVARRLVATTEARPLVIPAMVAWIRTGSAFDPRRRVLRSLPVVVQVKPLPATGQPPGFKASNVGSFTLRTQLVGAAAEDPVEVRTGVALTIEARLGGHGNPVEVSIQPPEGGQHFAVRVLPGSVSEVDSRAVPTRFTRTIGIQMVPLVAGTYRTPTIHLSYFDTELRGYRTLTSQGRMLKVSGPPVMSGSSGREVVPLLGGLTLGARGKNAARFEIGWPHFEATYVLAFNDVVDASPQLKLRFGRATQADVVGIEPGFEVRWTLWKDGDVSLAYVMEPAIRFWLPLNERSGWMGFTVGGPGIVAAYRLKHDLNLFWGFRVPISVHFGEPPDVIIPLLVDGGVEVGIMRGEGWSANFHGTLSTGLELCAGRCPVAQFTGELTFGCALVWE
jgi:hypothetical protein